MTVTHTMEDLRTLRRAYESVRCAPLDGREAGRALSRADVGSVEAALMHLTGCSSAHALIECGKARDVVRAERH